jgi:hypothetical protein
VIIRKKYFSQAHFSIDKKIIFGTVNPTSLRILSLSEGGGGWRKTFKISLIQFESSSRYFFPALI